MSLELYIDGASKGNPGPAAIGVVILKNGKIIKELAKEIGKATNNVAEYSALILALDEAKNLDEKKLKIFTDSELLYKQTTGKYKVKNENIKKLFLKVKAQSEKFDQIDIQHVPREQNKHADKLASAILNKKQTKMVAPLFNDSGEESPSSKG